MINHLFIARNFSIASGYRKFIGEWIEEVSGGKGIFLDLCELYRKGSNSKDVLRTIKSLIKENNIEIIWLFTRDVWDLPLYVIAPFGAGHRFVGLC